MTLQIVLTVAAAVAAIVMILSQRFHILRLKERNERQRLLIEEWQKPTPEKKPTRVVVQMMSAFGREKPEVIYGHKITNRKDGILEITDEDGRACAMFAPSSWVSVIAQDEQKPATAADVAKEEPDEH